MNNSPAGAPAPLESSRLRLVWMSPAFLDASLEGRVADAGRIIGLQLPAWWPEERSVHWMRYRIEQMRRDPEAAPWLMRAMVERGTGAMVGYINFHGPPIEGKAELGYTVFEEHRRKGYASEAALAMMRWAREEHGVPVFVVSISPDNVPSLAMAAKLGFTQVGTQMDEIDGEEWVFELASQPVGTSAGQHLSAD